MSLQNATPAALAYPTNKAHDELVKAVADVLAYRKHCLAGSVTIDPGARVFEQLKDAHRLMAFAGGAAATKSASIPAAARPVVSALGEMHG